MTHLNDDDIALIESLVAARRKLNAPTPADVNQRVRESISSGRKPNTPGWFVAHGVTTREAMRKVSSASF